MLHTSKPVEWEVFNYPPRHPVQYYSILKKKREFLQHIRQYDAQVFKQGCLHFCGIVPNSISSTLSNKYELFIIFFDDVPKGTSFIGFRVKVSKDTFIHESNSLLLFLKRSKKPLFYLMNNNCIHVQCGTNAWELFYLLYDTYLREYVLTVIGTQFFYHFVYSFCIQKEIQLLESLFKGSKIIRVSKKSIYYQIHRKRKISVSNLIYMTLNMPESKRCIISFNSKSSLIDNDTRNENFYTCAGHKIHVSKLVLKKFKREFQGTLHDKAVTNAVASANVLSSYAACNSEVFSPKCKEYKLGIKNKPVSSSSSTLKRKHEEIENDECDSQPGSSKFLKISASSVGVNGNHWEQYSIIKPYTVKACSDIPCLKYLVPKLLNNGESSHINNSDSYLFKNHTLDSVQSSIVLPLSTGKETDLKTDHLTAKERCEVADDSNLHSTTKNDYSHKFSVTFKAGTSDKLTNVYNIDSNSLKYFSSNLQIPNCEENESLHPLNFSSFSNSIKTSDILNSLQDEMNSSEDGNFMTAAGKTINISNTAMLTARRLIEDVCDDRKQQLLQSESTCTSNRKRFKKSPGIDAYWKSETEDMALEKTCISSSDGIRKSSEIPSEKLGADFSVSVDKNFKFNNIDNPEDVIFSTAAGKTISVSNTAMEAAQKLILDVFKEERTPPAVSNYAINKSEIRRNSNAFKNISFSPKNSVAEEMDVNMDKTFVEKFFEDTAFDDKELETVSESNKNKNTDVVLEPKSSNFPTHKPRKSLGGRRSMRFCSDTL